MLFLMEDSIHIVKRTALCLNFPMDFFELNAFVTLAGCLHFAKAASIVNLSPSALSRLVTRLEDETGYPLVDRDTRQVKLTKQGEEFLKFAKDCLNRKTELLNEMENESNKMRGTLHLYSSVTACYTIVPEFLSVLKDVYPELTFTVETGDPAGALKAIKECRADFAVSAIPDLNTDPKSFQGFSSIQSVSVRKSPLVFAAAGNSAYSVLEKPIIESLSTVPLILPQSGLARNRFDKFILQNKISPIIQAETAGNEAILALVRLGLGIGLVPQIVFDSGPFSDGLVLHDASSELGFYDIGFIFNPTSQGDVSSRRLRAAVEDILRKEYQ